MNRPAGRCRAGSRASRRAEELQANAATRIWLRILGKMTAIVLTVISAKRRRGLSVLLPPSTSLISRPRIKYYTRIVTLSS